MSFARPDNMEEMYEVYVPGGSVYVLTGEARWDCMHGIKGKMEDVVEDELGDELNTASRQGEDDRRKRGSRTVLRETRVSVTFRWMKEGADILL